jgi:hypothetical protein
VAGVAEVVAGDDLAVGRALEGGAEEVAADPPEAVDRDALHVETATGRLASRAASSSE